MRLVAEILAKVESGTLDGSVQYIFHVGLSKEGSQIESGEGGIKAALKVTAEEFSSYMVGDEIIFEEVENG